MSHARSPAWLPDFPAAPLALGAAGEFGTPRRPAAGGSRPTGEEHPDFGSQEAPAREGVRAGGREGPCRLRARRTGAGEQPARRAGHAGDRSGESAGGVLPVSTVRRKRLSRRNLRRRDPRGRDRNEHGVPLKSDGPTCWWTEHRRARRKARMEPASARWLGQVFGFCTDSGASAMRPVVATPSWNTRPASRPKSGCWPAGSCALPARTPRSPPSPSRSHHGARRVADSRPD